MTTDREQAQDTTRRGTNAFIGGIAGVVLIAIMISGASPSASGMLVVGGALIAGAIGAVIGWALPAAKD